MAESAQSINDMIINDLKEWGTDQKIIDAIDKLESWEYVSFHDLKTTR